MKAPFSTREGYRACGIPIVVREEAPNELRGAILSLAELVGLSQSEIRKQICTALLRKPDQNNWSESYISDEVLDLMDAAEWYRVYDIAEQIYSSIKSDRLKSTSTADYFAKRLNDFMIENGIGWKLENGQIERRLSENFSKVILDSPQVLIESGFQRASNEMREAVDDILRRPSDITGAIQHSTAALEAVAREVTGKPNLKLGALSSRLDLPKPLDVAVQKLWGYASEYARHGREGLSSSHIDAELFVRVASALCDFLVQRTKNKNDSLEASSSDDDLPF